MNNDINSVFPVGPKGAPTFIREVEKCCDNNTEKLFRSYCLKHSGYRDTTSKSISEAKAHAEQHLREFHGQFLLEAALNIKKDKN